MRAAREAGLPRTVNPAAPKCSVVPAPANPTLRFFETDERASAPSPPLLRDTAEVDMLEGVHFCFNTLVKATSVVGA